MHIFEGCMHKMCMASVSIHDLFNFGGIVGFSYVIMFASKYAFTYVSRKDPMYGMGFWYQLLLGMVSIVMVLQSFFVANLA